MVQVLCFTGGFAATNGYLLTLPSRDAFLIDAPDGIASWPALQEVQLRGLLLTHSHFDHVLDAAAVARRFGCPIHAHSQPDPSLTLEFLLGPLGMAITVPSYRVDVLLEESSAHSIGGLCFRILHIPGHSPDSLCFLPEATLESGAPFLLGGDVLFQGSIGRTDFPHGNHALLVQGIRDKLFTLPEDTVVFPGHGPSTTLGREKRANPFVRGG